MYHLFFGEFTHKPSKVFYLCFIGIAGLLFSFQVTSTPPATTAACSSGEYRQFDFWIGEWEVSNAKGEPVGNNHIFPILNGCALSENWQSVKGGKGVSYTFYDQNQKQWHQTWVDANGGALYLNGGPLNIQALSVQDASVLDKSVQAKSVQAKSDREKSNVDITEKRLNKPAALQTITLTGQHFSQQGESVIHQISWTLLPDGRVKQHWRSSKDQKKSWQDVFVGFYQKKK
ncbi:hypothetical protein [Aliikangiella maris]|uniref:DUF1579 domain-containing protein n=2 Tax=Aliikangiella maris TaxID=3162458 RepID=A0ABV3MUR2_9GAMM